MNRKITRATQFHDTFLSLHLPWPEQQQNDDDDDNNNNEVKELRKQPYWALHKYFRKY